jgi:hypothetical protein
MHYLPVELIEAIVRDRFHDDPTTAKSVSLVCRHLQYMGQEMAFRCLKILIPTGGYTGPLISKLEGLAARPLLLSYVTDLDLEVLGYEKECIQWMNQHVDLVEEVLGLVEMGKPLQALAISGQWGFRDWMTVSEGAPRGGQFRKRLYDMVAIPTIQSLDLIALYSIVLHRPLPALKHLTTRALLRSNRSGFRRPVNTGEATTAPLTPTVLETLHIQSSGGIGNYFDAFDYLGDPSNTHILLHSLRELHMLCSHTMSWDRARQIMDKCRSSVEVLTIKAYSERVCRR